MVKAVIVSGNLFDLQSNIKSVLDKQTDLFVHTWDTPENLRWIKKLERYKKYCRNFEVKVEQPQYETKLYSYFYSTYQAFHMMWSFWQHYDLVIKWKPNLDIPSLKYPANIEKYYEKARIQSRPLLSDYSIYDCIFGVSYFTTLDERVFCGKPRAFAKAFDMKVKEFEKKMKRLNTFLIELYGEGYEGSIFWTDWFKQSLVPVIQDTDLTIPNKVVS